MKLVREKDGKTVSGNTLKSVRLLMPARQNVVEKSSGPEVGKAVYLTEVHTIAGAPLQSNYWLTSEVIEILETNKEYTRFKTENNTYKFFRDEAK